MDCLCIKVLAAILGITFFYFDFQMGCCKKFMLLSLAIFAAIAGYCIHSCMQTPPVPSLPADQWWGPGEPPKTLDASIRPFKVQFDPERIQNLKKRLEESEWFTEPLEGVGFQYGFNGKYLKEVAEFWRTKYDFNQRMKFLNQYPQFKTNIQGMDIHFIHIKQANVENKRIVPLLLLHGWPGSVIEFYKMIPLLTASRPEYNFVFELIVPSLPGYGYSQAAAKTGLGPAQMSVVMHNLMTRLGYNKYVVQGGDWGALITNIMSLFYPENVYGYHTNMAFANTGMGFFKHFLGSFYPSAFVEERHVSKMFPMSNIFVHLLSETGYLHLQATKPDTVGIALKDSPIGLAAYILEKFSTWTNKEWRGLPNGGLTNKYQLTELLDNIMIYWDSRCITTSVRLYSEAFSKPQLDLKIDYIPVTVPTAIVRAGHEMAFSSKCQLKGKYMSIVQITDFDDLGHFAAFQGPELMANDIWSSIVKFDKFYSERKQGEL